MRACRRPGQNWQELYQNLDYDALYSDLGWEPTERVGTEDKGFCLDPWGLHKNGDTTGKLAINTDKGVYNCWVCGGGTLQQLVMEVKHVGYDDALRYLTRFVSAFQKESDDEFRVRIDRLLQEESKEKKPPPIFNPGVLDRFVISDPSEDWVSDRRISPEVAQFFKVGIHGEHRRYVSGRGEFVGQAVILPHFWRKKLVGWQERWLGQTPSWLPKYTNTTDFPRETTLWGYDFSLPQTKRPVICESVPTALRLISEGFPAIATFGASVTTDQITLLRVFQQGVILARDNDDAGVKWRAKLVDGLHRFIDLYEVPVVDGEGNDLGDVDDVYPYFFGVKNTLPDT